MPYAPTYTAPDLAPIATDAVGKGLVAAGTLAPVIVGVAGYKWLKRNVKSKKAKKK